MMECGGPNLSLRERISQAETCALNKLRDEGLIFDGPTMFCKEDFIPGFAILGARYYDKNGIDPGMSMHLMYATAVMWDIHKVAVYTGVATAAYLLYSFLST